MSVIKVNGGIINDQTLTSGLRYFKMTGPFAWTVSDGSVNLPIKMAGGPLPVNVSYFAVGADRPVPNSAAELAMQVISKNCDITIIGLQPGLYGTTTAIHFACSASGFNWGAGLTTEYELVGGNSALNGNPPVLATAAANIQAAVRALGSLTVPTTVGTADQTAAPATATANMATVVVTEVAFALA